MHSSWLSPGAVGLSQRSRSASPCRSSRCNCCTCATPAPSPRQLARRQRRKRQRERQRASRGAGEDALPSDDQVDGGSAVALSQADSGVVSAVRGGGKRARSSSTPASSPAASMSHSPSVCGAVVCGGGSPSAAAPAAAGPQKRKRAGGGSAEGGSSDVCRPSAVEDVDHERVYALAESVREELLHGGVPASDIRLRPLMLGDKLLPQFPVVRGGCAEKAAATALAGSVQSVLRGPAPPFDGLRRLITEGTAYQ